MLHVKRPTGGDLMLGFPHSEISNIVENVAVQRAHGRDASGRKMVAAFKTASFKVSRGPGRGAGPDNGGWSGGSDQLPVA